jgi:hypothetical protein
MARIEELQDDFAESLDLKKAARLDVDDDKVFEEMYYNRFAKKGPQAEKNTKSFEEAMQEFSKTPLFMNDLNDVADSGMQNWSHHVSVSANAEGCLQMVRMPNWKPSEPYNTKAPKLRLPKDSRSKAMRW